MNAWVVAAGVCAGLAAGVGIRPPLRERPLSAGGRPVEAPPDAGLLRRFRVLLACLAVASGVSLVGGATGAVLGLIAGGFVWVTCSRSEPPGVRREREAVARGLPHVTRLLGIVLGSGQSVTAAFGVVAEALPGSAVGPLLRARSALGVGVPPELVFADLARTPGLEPLGRALLRSAESGAPVADVVVRLADSLAGAQAASLEDRARTVGIRAAVPLGLCLLPSFLLLGIVPVVAGALGALQW